MLYCLIGFVSALAGFIVSPQFNLLSKGIIEIEYAVRCSVIMGGLMGLFSNICSHDVRMWHRSRLDFIVNVLVAALIGLTVAIGFLYIFKINLMGRWVLFVSFWVYVLIVILFAAKGGSAADSKVYLYGDGVKGFVDLVSSCRIKAVIKNKVCVVMDSKKHSVELFSGDKYFVRQCYIIPGPKNSGELESVVLANSVELAARVMSVNHVFEREYECINLDAETAEKWWEIETPFRRVEFIRSKRVLDLLLIMFFGLPALSIIVIAAIMIKLADGGPIFYSQTRLGQFRRPFSMFKMRTMVVDSEKNGAQWAKIGDSRVTKIGRILRLTRVDELPQIWNILRGDMSFIGPRPERPEFFSLIESECSKFGLRLVCKPGITGWAQINYPYGASVDDSIVKLMYDLYYIKNANLVMEIRILLRTVLAMVKGAR
jgi:lipopolysaccharide/colanic/teichoic acid biosynthesis glycosyltransferase